jgi:hypothetical protein
LKFALDAPVAPSRIVRCQAQDQLPQLCRQRRPAPDVGYSEPTSSGPAPGASAAAFLGSRGNAHNESVVSTSVEI